MATAEAEFQERIQAAIDDSQVPISAHPGLYEVAVEIFGSSPAEQPASESPGYHRG